MYKFIKRFTDLLLATIALVLLSPVFVVAMIILMLTGEHEVFYSQKRIGYKNRPFRIWKFATMYKDSSGIGSKEITLRNDPRVTIVGRILRMTKINELPQIINVYKGEMSIVGPRPLMEVSFNLYPEKVKNVVYNSKPGITGIGSLVFRDEEKTLSEAEDPIKMYASIYPYKGELELWYLQNASLLVDSKIILLTAWGIFFAKNNLCLKVFKSLPLKEETITG
ncbi:MAG: sugar transferase [Ginsengibacter sp.]